MSTQIERELWCSLTDEEVQSRVSYWRSVMDEREKVAKDARESAKDFKDQLNGLDGQARRLGDAVRDRRELRMVDCVVEWP